MLETLLEIYNHCAQKRKYYTDNAGIDLILDNPSDRFHIQCFCLFLEIERYKNDMPDFNDPFSFLVAIEKIVVQANVLLAASPAFTYAFPNCFCIYWQVNQY